MRVLIADDEPGMRLLVTAAVQRLGHEAIGAADGAEAWERFCAQRPEAVITDWDMPGLDGTELVRRIRAEAAVPYAYVLVLTGVAGEDAARGVMEAGADDLVAKPPDAAELERKLIAAARHRAAPAPARRRAPGCADRRRQPVAARRRPRRAVRARRALRPQLLRRDVRRRRLQGLQRRPRPPGRRRRAARRRRRAGRRRARRRPAVPLRRRGVRAAAGRAVAG